MRSANRIEPAILPAASASPSLLAKASSAEVVEEPFPFLVVRNALAPHECARLLKEMPPMATLAQGRETKSNQRVSYPYQATKTDASLSPTWKRFLDEHVGQAFLNTMMRVFGKALKSLHPRFEERCRPIDRLRAGVRGIDGFDRADVLVDAQICANTPVRDRASSVRGAHVDTADKLFVGLYYLRHGDDDSSGGDLQLYRRRPGWRSKWSGRTTSRDGFELCRTVPYEHNVLVLFLNSIESVHLVTARSPTLYPRLMVNLIGEVEKPLWRHQRRLHERIRQQLLWNRTMAMSWNAESPH